MWITNLFVNSPCKVLSIGFLVMILISIIPIAAEFYIVSDGGSGRDFLIWDDPKVLDGDRYILAKEFVQNHTGLEEEPTRSQLSRVSSLYNLYTNTGNYEHGLLKKDTLLKIQEIENKILDHQNYTKFCFATSAIDDSCSPMAFVSPLTVFKLAGVSDISALS